MNQNNRDILSLFDLCSGFARYRANLVLDGSGIPGIRTSAEIFDGTQKEHEKVRVP